MFVFPVVAVNTLQVVPSVLVSTLYPVIAEPLSFGVVQDRSTFGALLVAVSPVGASGGGGTV